MVSSSRLGFCTRGVLLDFGFWVKPRFCFVLKTPHEFTELLCGGLWGWKPIVLAS